MSYPGTAVVLVTFIVSFLVLTLLIFPRPRLYVYTFLAAFLVLGFLVKALVHTTFTIEFLEPVGDFVGTPQQWDDALLAAACAALGASIVRCGHLIYWRQCTRVGGGQETCVLSVPSWYPRWHGPIWMATIVVAVLAYAANLHFAFFQIGMNPKLILPFHGNVLVAWLVNIGLALWAAALLWWGYQHNPTSMLRTVFTPLLEGYFSSLSTLSRIAYPIHAGPFLLALWEMRSVLRPLVTRGRLLAFLGCFLLFFAASAVTVFALRIVYYTASTPGSMRLGPSLSYELPRLVVQRWVGLEGVLTASATNHGGATLFRSAVMDNPARGADSVYQTLAKIKPNPEPEKFTFLTNAGPVAILWLSGSLTVVFLGMATCVLVLVVTEEINRKLLRNPLLLAVSGASLANVFCQTTFPFLTAIFLLQMWVAIGFLVATQRFFRSPTSGTLDGI